jgi:hypothetical protein
MKLNGELSISGNGAEITIVAIMFRITIQFTKPPIQRVTGGSFPDDKGGRSVKLITHLHL